MSLQILVVDDEPLARARLRTLLADCVAPLATAGAEAGNAAQAMELLQRLAFDAVLLDIHMPGADGLALAQALRSLPQPPAVVFVTAYSEHAVAAFELDAVDYLTKPVRLERLQVALQKVERLLQARGTAPLDATPSAYRCWRCCISRPNSNTSRCVPPPEAIFWMHRSANWKNVTKASSCACTAMRWSRGARFAHLKSITTRKRAKAGRCA